ncbi:MAG: TolC family protein, partial [Muribaculaceae bacterium]|nr:TolC family protein [Muribaculaceae bacterium]
MRLFSKLLSLAFLISLPVAVYSQSSNDTLRLSRKKCVEIALQDNPTVKVADLEIKKMEYAKKEVKGSLLPSIDFSLAYQRSIELQSMSMNMG